jgi:hypothetical protein
MPIAKHTHNQARGIDMGQMVFYRLNQPMEKHLQMKVCAMD